MAMLSRSTLLIVGLLVASAAGAPAQQPRIGNARVTSQPAGSSLGESVRTLIASMTDAGWIGYSVPVVEGDRTMCCFDSGSASGYGISIRTDGGTCCPSCRLEPSSATAMTSTSRTAQTPGVVKLEGSGEMSVLMRVAERRVERIRVFSEDCELDAGGRAVTWIENVRPSDSVAFLESLVSARAERDRVTEGAIGALALHRDPAADSALERLLAPSQPEHVRRAVPFWLG